MADGSRGPRRREERHEQSTSTTNIDTDEGASPKPRLKTSSMIASIAGEGQRTKPAPFGHALVELAKQAGPRSSV